MDDSVGMVDLVFVSTKHKSGGGFTIEVIQMKDEKGEKCFVE